MRGDMCGAFVRFFAGGPPRPPTAPSRYTVFPSTHCCVPLRMLLTRPIWPLGKSRTHSGKKSSRSCRRDRPVRPNASIKASPVAAANPWMRGPYSKRSCVCCARGASGRRCPRNAPAVGVQSTGAFLNGSERVFSLLCGARGLLNMMRWKASRGAGKKEEIDRRKRMLLVDARGIPLSRQVVVVDQ